ncbi:MAG: peptidase dimerization domain-containing protein, partial [Oscillospiraceae bacterium]
MADAEVTDTCYVYGLPATPGHEGAPCRLHRTHGHVPDFPENVKPRVIENSRRRRPGARRGPDAHSQAVPAPALAQGPDAHHRERGHLLGADDKAGIAEIMTLIEQLQGGEIAHGRIAVCFTPDEEVGCGTANFDIPKLGADFAYTLDGGAEGEVVYENFNACSAVVSITGVNVHPGSAKNVMVNAALVATEFNAALPSCETPRYTEGYEG